MLKSNLAADSKCKKDIAFTVIIIYGHTHTHTTNQAWNYLIK